MGQFQISTTPSQRENLKASDFQNFTLTSGHFTYFILAVSSSHNVMKIFKEVHL